MDGVQPLSYGQPDHSFTLQAIMELQKSTGHIDATLVSMKESIDRMDGRIGKVEEKLSEVTRKIYAATVIIAILVAIGGFFVNKLWDVAMQHIAVTSQATTTETK